MDHATVGKEEAIPVETDPGDVAALIIATASGSRSAFADLYAATSPRLFALALRMLRRRDAAEDVLQEAYVRVWQKAGLYDPDKGAALAWLFAVLRRCALDNLRFRGREPTVDGDDIPDGVEAITIDGFDASRADRADLRACVDELEAKQRHAILLAYYYGLTHEELSTHLRSPLGTVKSWIRRGLQRLKECLER